MNVRELDLLPSHEGSELEESLDGGGKMSSAFDSGGVHYLELVLLYLALHHVLMNEVEEHLCHSWNVISNDLI